MRLPRKGATAAVAVSAVLLTGCTGNSSGIQVAAVAPLRGSLTGSS